MIDFKIKDLFFDRQKVVRAVGKAKRAVLSRAGAFIRQVAKTSIRRRKGSAPPGSPPYSHVGLLRRWILFGYDKAADSVVIGPMKLNKPSEAPSVLEHGGRTTIVRRDKRGRIIRRRVFTKARPYMGPALEKERPNLPARWANSVKGA